MILLQHEYDAIHHRNPDHLECNILTESIFFACFYVLSKGLGMSGIDDKLKDSEKHLRMLIVQAYEDTYHEKLVTK